VENKVEALAKKIEVLLWDNHCPDIGCNCAAHDALAIAEMVGGLLDLEYERGHKQGVRDAANSLLDLAAGR
jgi:hypothetical protein